MSNSKLDTSSAISHSLARFAREVFENGAEPRVLEHVRQVIIDQVGLQIACAELPWSKVVYEYMRATSGQGNATAMFYGDQLTAEAAAFVNGAFGHGQDFDDTYRPAQTHAGAVVVPTALAIGEEVGASGEQILRSVTAGLEVMLRVAQSVSPHCLRKGHHPLLVAGPFGSATSAALLLDLDHDRFVQALGIAGSFPGGLVEYTESGGSVKRIHAAIPTTGGIRAANFARLGMTGPETVLEGAKGVANAFSEDPNIAILTDGLGERFVLEDLALKGYNCCYFIHPALDAFLEVTDEHELAADDIKSVSVGTSLQGLTHVGQITDPHDQVGAQFSTQFTLAMALIRERPGLESYSDECLADPAVRELAALISVEEDDLASEEYPANWGSIVTVETNGGETFSSRVRHPRGTPQNPMTIDEIREKFERNVHPLLGEDQTESLYGRLSEIEQLATIGELMELVCAKDGKAARDLVAS